jgi:hypothetical protein
MAYSQVWRDENGGWTRFSAQQQQRAHGNGMTVSHEDRAAQHIAPEFGRPFRSARYATRPHNRIA